ncbi:hypothetical protein M9R32_00790 [Paenisporosarcina quisquiliarum]|uniref:Uncharacterized protein n=1 Tax=Paenisporosarcina quisquiliarum TaxID=365346 RepID=A0A9X3LD33_9BACL|nr:hypothetical protein [Paenisporosarcina quisquiliarum]
MTKFIDDFAGAIFDIFKFVLKSLSYFIAGMLIVGVPLYLIVLVINFLK